MVLLQCPDLVALPTWGEGPLPDGPLAAQEPLFILLPPGHAQQAAQLAAKCCSSSAAAGSSSTPAQAATAAASSSTEICTAEASSSPQVDAAGGQQLLLVRTNEAQLSVSLAEQVAKAAGWDLAALKAAAVTKASMIGACLWLHVLRGQALRATVHPAAGSAHAAVCTQVSHCQRWAGSYAVLQVRM